MRRILTIVASLLLAGCSSMKDKAASEEQVAAFHAAYDAGRFADLYRDADRILQKTSPESLFIEYLSAVHRKLGRVKATKQVNWRAFYGTSGNRVTLVYQTDFEQGVGLETFVFGAGAKPQLQGYTISSDALVLR